MDRFPQWAPTGSWIAFHRQYLDEPGTPKHIMVLEIDSGHVRDLSPGQGMSYEFGRGCWSPDAENLVATARGNNMSRLVLVQVHEGQVTEFLAGDDLVGAMFDPNGNCIIVTRLRRIEIYSYPDLQLEHVIQLPERTYVLQALTGPS